MRRTRTYAVALALLALSVGAMAWATLRPGHGPLPGAAAAVDQTFDDVVHWYRSGPGDGHPNWDIASRQLYDADPDHGARLMIEHGCGACHAIPGVTGAHGSVGPSLQGSANRAYVGGVLPNEPGHMVRWLVDPTVYAPNTAMPDLGVTEPEARDMAAYLYTLWSD